MILRLRQRVLEFPRHRPLIMGIVNVNDDSFCGDGTLDVSAALIQAREMVEQGADFIDVGAESARTNRGVISVQEEIARLQPFVEGFAEEMVTARPWDEDQVWPPILSVNSWRSEVVREILPLGVDLLNDIGALPDAENARLCAQHGTALLIMHSVGKPKMAHTHLFYHDVLGTVAQFFEEKLSLATKAGLAPDATVLDPGIDFAKQAPDNLKIYAGLEMLRKFQRPILLPVSRKTVIGKVLGIADPTQRDAGTVACIVAGMRRGAHIFRVHNVKAAAQAVKVLAEIAER